MLAQKHNTVPGSPGAWQRLKRRFAVKKDTANLGGRSLVLPELSDPIRYIEERMAESGTSDLPYWTKLWPGSIVLAAFVNARKGGEGRVLELGAGLGVPGLVAAAHGRRVVLSDLEPDALEFARAAVELNDLAGNTEVRALDWTAPPEDLGTFDTVLGSEILYHPPLYPALVELLDRILSPSGTVFITHEERPFHIGFFDDVAGKFTTRTTSSRVRAGKDQDAVKVYLHAVRRK